MILQTFNTF